MSADVRCSCGVVLRAPEGFVSGRAICPVCRSTVMFGAAPSYSGAPHSAGAPHASTSSLDAPLPVTDFLDPPPQKKPPSPPATPWTQRMMAALLDPRSIQWMMMLGGGLMVLGIIVWLVSKGIFQNTLVLATALTLGALAVHGSGCFVALKTRYKIAGQALTFLGCILIPLNLWFYHAHNLRPLTLETHLWLGGVICCAIYVATLLLLRDPLFMYAIEGGVTLTVALLLANQGYVTDAGYLSVVLMGLALISIHAERAFPTEDAPFDRKRFGLPVFWSGHVQLAAALLTLLGSQLLAFVLASHSRPSFFQGWTWTGNWLTERYLLAGTIWLLGAYAYFYSDLVVRRIGVYVYLAAACLIAAELTFIGDRLPAAVLVATPAITAVLLTLVSLRTGPGAERLSQNLQPLALLLAGLSVVIGVVEHVRATSVALAGLGWHLDTDWAFVIAMLLVTACTRALAVVFQIRSPKFASAYLFLSAASVLVALAGILRSLGVSDWSHQAPILMLAPIGYIIAARLWRGQQPEWPLAVAAQVSTAVILIHLLFSTIRVDAFLVPVQGSPENLWIALVFAEATIFYLLATFLRRRADNIYAATACACAVIWQVAGFYSVPSEAYTVLYAVLGLVVLASSRIAGIEHVRTFYSSGVESSTLLGRGAAAFYSATALLSLAFISCVLQGLTRLSTQQVQWPLFTALAITTLTGIAAAVISPTPTWRRIYVTWSIALACITFLALNVLIDLTVWQKIEIFCTALGIVLLVGGYIGRFLEGADKEDKTEEGDGVTLALLLGSILAPTALLISAFYYRFYEPNISYPDEFGLVLVAVLMLVTGYSLQLKAPTLFGGVELVMYLLVLVGMLAIRPNVAMGVYLAAGGALLFGAGIALSIYRERLLALPERIRGREGVFRVLNWR